MRFQDFLKQAEAIVAAHKAEYQGVYTMKGGVLAKILNSPITKIGTDLALTATGNPEFIPLANAGETATGNYLSGHSIGKSLGQGAISGGEALAGQEAAGAVGIGQGNTAFNSALGITGDNPTGTGLPDLGNLISQAVNGGSAGASGIVAPAGDVSVSGASPSLQAAVDTGNTFTAAPTAGTAAGSTGAGGFLNYDLNGNPIGASAAPVNTAAPSAGIMDTIKQALTGGGSSGGSGILSKLGTLGQIGAGGAVLKNLLAPAPKGTNELLTAGSNALTTEQNLINSEASGKLPPGQQQIIDKQVQDAQTAIRSKYASMGLSGSTQEQQALQAASDQGVALTAQAAQEATQSGLSALGATNQIYSTILQSILNGNNNLNSSIATLAGTPSTGVQRVGGSQGNIAV